MTKKFGMVGNGTITVLTEITEQEYAEYNSNLKILLNFSNKQQLFNIVNLNFEELKKTLDKYLIEFKKDSSMNWARMQSMSVDINRLLLNFLSAFRTFLDHTECTLKGKYGKESDETKKFKNLCSEQYDQHFAYRFLYKLRNYTQHCGMPLGRLTISSKAINSTSQEVEDYLAIFFDRDILLKDYDSWGQVKNEIEKLQPQIEITSFVDEVMECISKINLLVIEYDLENIFRSSEYFQNLLIPFKSVNKTPAILDIIEGNGREPKINIEWLPLYLINMVQNMKSKNHI